MGAAEKLGYFGLGHRATNLSDFDNFLWSEEFLESGDAADINGVLPIGLVIDPLKIGDNVVPFVAVDVVDHGKVGWIGEKRERDKAMDEEGFSARLMPQADVEVAQRVGTRSQNFTINLAGPIVWPSAKTVKASYAAEVGDFVKASVFGNRNRSPFFNNSAIHGAGRPSGEIGSMVKGPLHASTSSGSAIMASGSATYNRSHVNAG